MPPLVHRRYTTPARPPRAPGFPAVEALESRRLLSAPASTAAASDEVDAGVRQSGNYTDAEVTAEQTGEHTGEHADAPSPGGNASATNSPGANSPGNTAGGNTIGGDTRAGASSDKAPAVVAGAAPPVNPGGARRVDSAADGNAGRADPPDRETPGEPSGTEAADDSATGPAPPAAVHARTASDGPAATPGDGATRSLDAGAAAADDSALGLGHAQAPAGSQAAAAPFGGRAASESLPPVIASDASNKMRPGPFSVVAIAGPAAEAIARAVPAAAGGAGRFAEAVVGGERATRTAARGAYHFARVSATALFSDALARFINDCAALAPAAARAEGKPAHRRAWRVTLAVIAADVVLAAYVLHRASDKRRARESGRVS